MASSLPPVKNAAFTFYTALVSQADTDIFKTSPTLAAGDITVSKDGGAFANIGTLPTQIGTTGVLPVALAADEMNADVVVVKFVDASGAEWQDQLVTIYTAAQTLDTTDGVADAVKTVTDKVDTALVLDGAVYKYTANALEEAPGGASITAQEVRDAMKLAPTAGAPAAGSVDEHLDDILTDTGTTLPAAIAGISATVTVAMSSTQAAQVAAGSLAIRCHHTFSQSITSTSTAALNTATKLWIAIKEDEDDADSGSVVFIEAAGGLTVLAETAYVTTGHGTLVVSGNSGAWQITACLDEVATGLLTAYVKHTLYAEVKALVGTSTVSVWDGTCEVSRGIVQAVA